MGLRLKESFIEKPDQVIPQEILDSDADLRAIHDGIASLEASRCEGPRAKLAVNGLKNYLNSLYEDRYGQASVAAPQPAPTETSEDHALSSMLLLNTNSAASVDALEVSFQ